MKLDLNCITCNISQVNKVMDILSISESDKEKIMREVLKYLSQADYLKCNPEIIRGTWNIITKYSGNRDPYKDIKNFYNLEVLKLLPELQLIIDDSKDRLYVALKIAIEGNLIDFAAKHDFSIKTLKDRLISSGNTGLAVDHYSQLKEKLFRAKSLLYIGDNCGEICLDKLFIYYIKEEFPKINVTYVVRGSTVINDVTLYDSKLVAMEDVAEVIDNGDDSLGTVLTRVGEDFKSLYNSSDVIIAKGQGNFESLADEARDNLYHLFMAKCEPVAKLLNVDKMSILCINNLYPNS